jgi:hypothetical protein
MKSMSSSKYLRCFVAMILKPNSDADRLYRKVIKSTLRKTRIRAFRIDEIEHSENIDERILAEITRSNILLADLTYARPSVYFEAGYAMGKGLRVVFTCRSDHFSPKTISDLAVHFDVNHRKIIEWKDPKDKSFGKRLGSHVRAVSKPLFERIEKDDRKRREELAFAKLSVRQRLMALFEQGVKVLAANGFQVNDSIDESKEENRNTTFVWSGKRRSQRLNQAVTLQVLEKYALRKQGAEIVKFLMLTTADRLPAGNAVSAHMLVVVLNSVGLAKLESYFPDFIPTEDHGAITLEYLLREVGPEKRLFIHVMSKPRSITDFRIRLTRTVENLKGEPKLARLPEHIDHRRTA